MLLLERLAAPLFSVLLAALAPLPAAEAAPAAAIVQEGPQVLYSSTQWKKDKYAIAGSYRIEQAADGARTLVLGRDFATKDGPDLKLVLSPQGLGEVKAKTALRGGLVLGLLKDSKGESRFPIPADADLDGYRSLLVHCEQYTVLWGGAPLRPGEVVASGSSWTKKTNKISGGWELARLADGRHAIRLGRDFSTKNAPDLKLVLSPLSVKEAKNDNALRGGKIVSLLESNKGAQEFVLPAGTDLSKFRSVLIHCEQYTKLWGAAPLELK